ncbi:unnamed protein product [Prunus armeniaca]
MVVPEDAISTSKGIKLQSSKNADFVLGLLRNHGFCQTQISWDQVVVPRKCKLYFGASEKPWILSNPDLKVLQNSPRK